MKSFRAEREKRSASLQVIVTLLVLLTSIVLVRFLPGDISKGPVTQKDSWESSVVKIP